MKKLKSIFTALLLSVLFTTGAFAQSAPKIIAVVNQAEWCSVCKANGQRAFAAFMENNKEGAISLVVNDVTNAESQKKSSTELSKVGLNDAMLNYKASGVIYFFDAATKEPITQITVANSNEEIGYVMSEVIKSIK